MRNRGWVIGGIIIFAALTAFPFYWNALGRHEPFPELELPLKEKKCIEPVEYMRTDHMHLLVAWRIAVVRDDLFIYTASDGKQFEMNMQKTCLGCHKSRDRFCTRCHDYNDVKPPCWNCHVVPAEAPPGRRVEASAGGPDVGRVNHKGETS
jgi:hypothetical protein